MHVENSSPGEREAPVSSPARFVAREHCPACWSRSSRTLFSRSYAEPVLRDTLQGFYGSAMRRDYHLVADAVFELRQCADCELIFQYLAPDDHLLGRLYETWIDPEAGLSCRSATLRVEDHLDIARDVFLALSLLPPDNPGRRTLDFGCGWGDWGAMTHAFGHESWGTELSSAQRAHCIGRGVRMVRDGDLPESYFDVINLNQVLEHLPEPKMTFQMLCNKLSPGGVIRAAVPNGRFVPSHLRRFDREIKRPQGGGLYAVAPFQHLSCFRTETLVALGVRCGVQRVKPSWSALLRTWRLPAGARATLKALARPFYVRSAYTTDLYFRKPA